MAKESKGQQAIVERVMHEFKHGELTTAAGDKVTSRRQAVAIGLSEAGASDQKTPAQNKRNRARTERGGSSASGPTKAELYERAKNQDVPGRSRMSKAELAKSVG
ncbi:hypothetical protein SAMN05192583_0692 [Sphingomonas gellani]|uniref:Rho termination factor, N-terminal domain n=1 Tax=Sphingomonas gellani TaxID=1166340 RepID=A0A1H7ZJC2_9SPHN|nr:DUF6496 domain-containing protein [Sphingomonas gellani]SEM57589.1 hypothetical protein SAMN05192583_0692 [Sphingomonas gellani]